MASQKDPGFIEGEHVEAAAMQHQHLPLPRMLVRPHVAAGLQGNEQPLDLILVACVQQQMRAQAGTCLRLRKKRSKLSCGDRAHVGCPLQAYFSGSGMNSVSPGTGANRPVFHSSLACSIRSLREDTKFHQM